MRKFLFAIPFAALLLSSCGNLDTPSGATTTALPSGTFTGQFRKIHRNASTNKLDTVKANFRLVMSIDSGYKVTADTTTIHAGSKGPYQINAQYVNFIDKTYPATGIPPKIHLAGTYIYAYDGSAFKIANVTTLSDTLYFQYDLKKQ